MRHFATHRRWVPLTPFTVAVLVAVLPAPAGAQLNPIWDHYKQYQLGGAGAGPFPAVILIDQFAQYNHTVLALTRFMNPTEKTVLDPPPGVTYPIHDPLLHYAWWQISPHPFTTTITTTDQFGDHTLTINHATNLLNPALKSHDPNPAGGPIPLANHYKCYNCDGLPLADLPVRLTDQFGPWDAFVQSPRFFCNPAEKRVINADGTTTNYPIVDPELHYTCYDFWPLDPIYHPVFITDQFVASSAQEIGSSFILCVPTLKHEVTSTRPDTWGKIKVLYR